MSRIPFKRIRRQSLWEVYGKRCFYCDNLLLLSDCEVDHIISQDLKKKPQELKRILKYYQLPDDFDIDSLYNRVPCHPSCNKKKGNKRYSKRAINFYIEQAKSNARKVEELENSYKDKLEKDYGQGLLTMILERGLLSKSDIWDLIECYELAQLTLSDDTQVFTFSLNVDELFEFDLLPDEAPREYPYLCDWLRNHLVEHLASIISTPFYPVEDSRDGETFGVRVVFFRLDEKEFQRFSIEWWEIFHEGHFTEVYGEPPSKYFVQSEM